MFYIYMCVCVCVCVYTHTHTHITQPLKKEILPFVSTWMDLEIIIVSEIRRRKTNITWYRLHVESKKNDTNELIYKIETDSQTQKTNLWLPKGKGDKLGVWD